MLLTKSRLTPIVTTLPNLLFRQMAATLLTEQAHRMQRMAALLLLVRFTSTIL